MNAPLLSAPRVEPFFFDADPGTRFSLYHAAAPHLPPRGAILYIHPFAEELNRSRRMAALQSRRFAAQGFAVLQIDLFGCGDSCGDFRAARWEIWQRDLSTALAWLAERSPGPLHLWGLRLGALLALDFARTTPVDGLVLWHPNLDGHTAINQFLRQGTPAEPGPHPASLQRARLAAVGVLEVAGYELAAALADAIDNCAALAMRLPSCPVHWFGSGSAARQGALARRLRQRWSANGTTLEVHHVDGHPFWQHGAPHCQALLDATAAVFAPIPP